jgi:acyl carrier protein
MAASLDNRNQTRLAAQGMESIPLEQGMQILGNLLQPNAAQVGVLPINWSKFLEKFPIPVPSFLESFKVVSEQPVTQQPAFLQQLKAAPASDRRNLLITHICTEVARLLGLDSSEQVDIQQGLLDIGIDSLMAVELRKFLQSSLGFSIPATLAFDYPTIAALGDYLVREVMKAESDESATLLDNSNQQKLSEAESNLDRLSDSEAEALLLSKLDSMKY